VKPFRLCFAGRKLNTSVPSRPSCIWQARRSHTLSDWLTLKQSSICPAPGPWSQECLSSFNAATPSAIKSRLFLTGFPNISSQFSLFRFHSNHRHVYSSTTQPASAAIEHHVSRYTDCRHPDPLIRVQERRLLFVELARCSQAPGHLRSDSSKR
jgi:hypothetical protein